MEELNPSYMVIDGVQYVTTAEAAKRLGADVTTDMIKDWVKRRILKPVGRYAGGSNIYRLSDVAYAEMRTRTRRQGRTRRSGELQKIADPMHNLPTSEQANCAQKPSRPRCIVVSDNGHNCRNVAILDAPFDICRKHMREVHLFWREHLDKVCGVEDEPLPVKELPLSQNRHQFVYYIRFGDRIKIGHTTNIVLRLPALPYDELLAIEPGPIELERIRQRQFDTHRITPRGEWFAVHPGLIEHTAMLVGHYGTAEAQMVAAGYPAPPHKSGVS